ncbi:MAG: lysophospholipid acyltransferase family protein [Pseudomonadota bacterium]
MSDPWHKRLGRHPAILSLVGRGLAGYVWLVDKTARKVDSTEAGAQVEPHLPAIFTFWHGEHFMTAMGVKPSWNMHVMISRSADGTINAVAAEALGIKTIRGAGDPKRRKADKGGARAFLQFARLLGDGASVAMTADVPKVARQVSPGLIRLAQRTGRPIIPGAYVTHPRVTLSSWDRASVHLPFTRAAIGTGEAIYVDSESRDEADWCALVKERLDAITARSYALIGSTPAFGSEEAMPHG